MTKFKKTTGWALSVGVCPGILVGARTYTYNDGNDHILYIGCFTIIVSTYYD